MTDNESESTKTDEQDKKPIATTRQVPEMSDFEITVTRKFESSYSNEQLKVLIEEYGAEDKEEAVQLLLSEREVTHIEPTEKLIALEIDANRPSND